MKKQKIMAILGGVSLFAAAVGVEAARPTLRVRCETRPTRARISVDGNNFPAGAYNVTVTSGVNNASTPATVVAPSDEFETDFDSDPGDIADGATAIGADFIVNCRVNVTVGGPANLSKANVLCRAKRN